MKAMTLLIWVAAIVWWIVATAAVAAHGFTPGSALKIAAAMGFTLAAAAMTMNATER